jgi:hypothetical protein
VKKVQSFELEAGPKREIPTEFGLFFENCGQLVLKREITSRFRHELEYKAFRISSPELSVQKFWRTCSGACSNLTLGPRIRAKRVP